MKAVSERLFSSAIDCRRASGRPVARRHTAAGLPANGTGAKASTCHCGISISLQRFRGRDGVLARCAQQEWLWRAQP
jgi:hypothetical protein